MSRLYKYRASAVAASATTRVPETASRSSSTPCGADGPPPSSCRTCAACRGLAAARGARSQELGGKGLRRRAGGVGSRGTMQMPVLNTEASRSASLRGLRLSVSPSLFASAHVNGSISLGVAKMTFRAFAQVEICRYERFLEQTRRPYLGCIPRYELICLLITCSQVWHTNTRIFFIDTSRPMLCAAKCGEILYLCSSGPRF